MDAKQLIDAAQQCVTCGKIHEPVRSGAYISWAAADGHRYVTRLYEMTRSASGPVIAALQVLAGESP